MHGVIILVIVNIIEKSLYILTWKFCIRILEKNSPILKWLHLFKVIYNRERIYIVQETEE